jgi:hypothetical protein
MADGDKRRQAMSRKTRKERQKAHDREVVSNRRRLREAMAEGKYVYAAEWRRKAEREGDFARVEAIDLEWDALAEHNRRVGGGTRSRIQDELSRVGRKRLECEKERARSTQEGWSRATAGITRPRAGTPASPRRARRA